MDRAQPDAAAGAAGAGVSQEQLLEMYRVMVRCRTLDERVWLLNRQGKAAIVASAQGHEAGQLGTVWALRRGHDRFYIYYRDLAVLVGLGMTPAEIMRGFMARDGEPLSGARQFPTHGAHAELKLVNLSNVVATQIPQAVGAALASRLRGDDAVTIVYFGDGASSVGDCHEAMNFAAIHRLPVIFFCENNGYAISVPLSAQMAVDSVASRAQGYGMPGVVVDGTDAAAVYEAATAAAARARSGEGPTLIEAMVERYLPHTSDDDDTLYRERGDIEKARLRDPLVRLQGQLRAAGVLSDEMDEEIRAAARREIDEATEEVESAPYPQTSSFHRDVYASGGGPSP